MIVKHQWRRESSAYWAELNITPDDGEPIYETNTGRFKIGDGVTQWSELPYFVPGDGTVSPMPGDLLAHVNASEPHPIYDDGPSLLLLYQNAKV